MGPKVYRTSQLEPAGACAPWHATCGWLALESPSSGPSSVTGGREIAGATVSESKPSRTVLIVDDEQSLRDALEMTFSREGYQVLKASDGPEALEAARASVPDVVLLDVI